MTGAGWMTLAIIGVASVLLVKEWLRPDLIALLVILGLSFSGILNPQQALSGFSQTAVITILAVFILSDALQRTGVTRWVGQRLARAAGPSERRLTGVLVLTAAALSTFMNNIAATAVLLPVAIGISRQTQVRPSRLLMPIAFGTLLGGTATLLTTANIIVSTTLSEMGLKGYGLLDFAPIGIPLIVSGTLVIVWLGPRLLPKRDVAGEIVRAQRLRSELAQVYQLPEGLSEVTIRPGSGLAGQTLAQGGWGESLGLTVVGILRHGRVRLAPDREARVEEGDSLLLEGTPTPEHMTRFGLGLANDAELRQMLDTEDVPLVEVILAPRSELAGQTLKEIRFRERFGIQVLAIWRGGLVIQQGVADRALNFGDAMLMQGPRDKIELLRLDPNFLILTEEAGARLPSRRAALAAVIMLVSLGAAATGVLPIAIATLAGAALMVLTGCLTMDQAYRSVEWKAIFLIAGMLPLAIALQVTGTAGVLGQSLVAFTGGLGPTMTAAVLLVGTIGLSLLVGGQTAAVILAPVAIEAAPLIDADPRGLAMAVAIGCSLAFVSPLGHPASLLVMGPGGYAFRDYSRLGTPLLLVTVAVTLAGLHWIWGL